MITPDALRNQSVCAFPKNPLRFEGELPIKNVRDLPSGIYQVWWTTPMR
jgi:hypothetical protein